MKFIRRAFFSLAFAMSAVSLVGCSGTGSTPGGALESLRESPVLQNAARAVLSGKIYDKAAISVRNGDVNALGKATQELAKIDPLAAAEQLVNAAGWLDSRAMSEKDPALKTELESQSAQKYRQALEIAPAFPSKNAMLLNALGYFLADRGESLEDFQTAEKLTRASLKLLDKEITEIESAPLSGSLVALKKFTRGTTARDSLAWALFRQNKFEAARKEQLSALKEAVANAETVAQTVSPELYFHLAEIERALKNFPAAKANYQAALKVDPNHEPSLKGLLSLTGSTPGLTPAPKPDSPSPEPVPLPESDDAPAALSA